MQVGKILRHALPLGIEPGSFADAVPRIHGGLAALGLSAKVGVPSESATGCGGQRLTTLIGAGEAAQISSFTRSRTGDEETHGLRRLLPLGKRERGPYSEQRETDEHRFIHRYFPSGLA